MTTDDREKLMVEMSLKWPGKFSDTDLAYWCRELDAFDVQAVILTVTAWKCESKFVPKLPEIKARLAKHSGAVVRRNQSRYQTCIAMGIVQSNPSMDGRPEAELILRYHRYWFFRYRKSIVSEDGHESEIDRQRIDACLRTRKSQCIVDLMGAGHEKAMAETLSDWIDAPKPDFDGVVAGLNGIGVAA